MLDKNLNLGNISNFRAIALTTVMSKQLEVLSLNRYHSYYLNQLIINLGIRRDTLWNFVGRVLNGLLSIIS